MVQEIKNKISEMKAGFRQSSTRRRAFETALRDHYENLRELRSSTRSDIEKSLPILSTALNEPGLVDQSLVIAYIS